VFIACQCELFERVIFYVSRIYLEKMEFVKLVNVQSTQYDCVIADCFDIP